MELEEDDSYEPTMNEIIHKMTHPTLVAVTFPDVNRFNILVTTQAVVR
eukprot:COSAG06_NODE_47487_length_338_cov_922.828452_1_plen_47_part_01